MGISTRIRVLRRVDLGVDTSICVVRVGARFRKHQFDRTRAGRNLKKRQSTVTKVTFSAQTEAMAHTVEASWHAAKMARHS
jgi:hypothetical protein